MRNEFLLHCLSLVYKIFSSNLKLRSINQIAEHIHAIYVSMFLAWKRMCVIRVYVSGYSASGYSVQFSNCLRETRNINLVLPNR